MGPTEITFLTIGAILLIGMIICYIMRKDYFKYSKLLIPILKALLASLNYGDEINAEIDAEIKAIEEAAAAEEEAGEEGADAAGMDTADAEVATETEEAGAENIDLGSLEALESFNTGDGDILLEDQTGLLLTEDDLPSPEDLDSEKDFSENN